MRMRWVAAICTALLCASTAHAITADELVAKNVAARGGIDKLKAIQSLRLEGKLLAAGGFEIASVQTWQRPDSYRFEGTVQGLTLIQSYDGKEGWRVSPFGGRKDAERMAIDDVKGLAEQADLDGGWVDAASKHNALEYLGIEDVDGTLAHKLKVTLANGDIEYVFFDPEYFLVIRMVQQQTVRGVELQQETEYSDYEQVNGVYFPFASASGGVGDTQKSKTTIDKAQANATLTPSLFAFPQTPAAPGK